MNDYNYQLSEPKNQKPQWAAITSFVLSIVNVVSCCCFSFVLAPLSLVFGIVSLVKKWALKGLAIAGVIISSISLVYLIAITIMFGEVYQDFMILAMKAPAYVEEYNETGEIPEEFSKYCDSKYDYIWESMGYDSFEEFYDVLIEELEKDYNNDSSNDNRIDDDSRKDSSGERHIDI